MVNEVITALERSANMAFSVYNQIFVPKIGILYFGVHCARFRCIYDKLDAEQQELTAQVAIKPKPTPPLFQHALLS